MQDIIDLTSRLKELSDYADDEKFGIKVEDGQETDVLINDDLVLHINCSDVMYKIQAYNPEDPAYILDELNIYRILSDTSDEDEL